MSIQVAPQFNLVPAEVNAIRREAERAGATNPLLELRLLEQANRIELARQSPMQQPSRHEDRA